MTTKTNAQYLRHILDTLGNLMGPNNYTESIEWLDAIEKELSVSKEESDSLSEKLEEVKEELLDKEEMIIELQDKVEEYRAGTGLANKIDTHFGSNDFLYWECRNLAIQSLMETLGEELAITSHLEMERRIKG